MHIRGPEAAHRRDGTILAVVAAVLAGVVSPSTLMTACSGLNLDRRSWEVEASCPLACFGSTQSGKVAEALSLQSPHADSTPPFDLTGTWAQRQLTAAITAAPLLGESINSSVNTLRMEIVQDGHRLHMTAEVCAIDQTSTSSAGRSVIPRSFVDAIGLTERTVNLHPTGAGYQYREERYVRVLGMELADELNEPIPSEASDVRVLDHDADGHPGVSVLIEGLVDGAVYVVQRHWEELCGTVLSQDRIEGYILWEAEQNVLGASSFVLEHTPETWTHPDWELNRFELRRVDPEMTCESIIDSAEQIFAD